MEPLFFKAENGLGGGLTDILRKEGFNGAAFFQSGKSKLIAAALTPSPAASMEPLFFKAENGKGNKTGKACCFVLQWSRFFSKRKICSRHARARTRRRFNGAAFFQSGKSTSYCWKSGRE